VGAVDLDQVGASLLRHGRRMPKLAAEVRDLAARQRPRDLTDDRAGNRRRGDDLIADLGGSGLSSSMHELHDHDHTVPVTRLRDPREPPRPLHRVQCQRPAVGPPGRRDGDAADVDEAEPFAGEASVEAEMEVTDGSVVLEQRRVDRPEPEAVSGRDGAQPQWSQGATPGGDRVASLIQHPGGPLHSVVLPPPRAEEAGWQDT
jgi:hypothetical protein